MLKRVRIFSIETSLDAGNYTLYVKICRGSRCAQSISSGSLTIKSSPPSEKRTGHETTHKPERDVIEASAGKSCAIALLSRRYSKASVSQPFDDNHPRARGRLAQSFRLFVFG
jgi:hypothetical protein